MFNEKERLTQRRRIFNVPELKRLAATSINQRAEDVVRIEKLIEGGWTRAFLITMHDGFQLVARIPYSINEPKHLVVASEVATMDYLRLRGLPIPKVYGYSTTSDNPSGIEYVFMDYLPGKTLMNRWLDLNTKERYKAMNSVTELEGRLFALEFPASGSLYYSKDLPAKYPRVNIPGAKSGSDSGFCVGPETSTHMWWGKRLDVETDRGPYLTPLSCLTAGAKKEIAYLTKHGKPIHPFNRAYREAHKYTKQSPLQHITHLTQFLKLAPYILGSDTTLLRPTLRHPGKMRPNKILQQKLQRHA